MRFAVQTRWVDGVPHLQLRGLESGEVRMQWRLVRTCPAASGERGRSIRSADRADTLTALIRELLLVACAEDMRCRPPAKRNYAGEVGTGS